MNNYITQNEETNYLLSQLETILSIDSPTGYTKRAAQYVYEQYRALGFNPQWTNKGGLLVCVNEGTSCEKDAILLQAHLDTLGAMVCEIKSNGALRCTPLGGMNANNAESETVRIYTKTNHILEGTCQLKNASVHVNKDYSKTERTWDTLEIVLDEEVYTKQDTQALGIMVGDFICFEPRTQITKSGYIKSRFLDDKLSVSILLAFARFLKQASVSRKIYQHITVFEEVGHGGAASFPQDVNEVLSVDMGCVGEGLTCKETQVSICVKDSGGPYHYDVVSSLIQCATAQNIDFAADVYPFYGSDAEAALRAGHDVRHGLIGAGVYASHGYERSHVKGAEQTLALLKAYLASVSS